MEQLLLNYINEQIFSEFMYRNPNRISKVKYVINKESGKICNYYRGDNGQFKVDITWDKVEVKSNVGDLADQTLYIYIPKNIILSDDINYDGIFWEVERKTTNLSEDYSVSKYEKTSKCKKLKSCDSQFIKDAINFEIPIFIIIKGGEVIEVQRIFPYKNSKAFYKTELLINESINKFILSDINLLENTNVETSFSNNSNIRSNMLNFVINIDTATDTHRQFRFRTVKESLNPDHNFAICDFQKIDTNLWIYNESTINSKKQKRNTRNANFAVDSEGIIKSIQITKGNIGSDELYKMNVDTIETEDSYIITIETVPYKEPTEEDKE